jgi:hypothetical protein
MYVYFIKAGDAIKVGIASDVTKRLINVQVGNPHKIDLLHSLDVSEEKARSIETIIHEIFKKTNLSGEWFQAPQFMIDFIHNIKENGWESHYSWIENRYQRDYGSVLDSLKTKIEHDIIGGNVVSLEKLQKDLGKLVNTIYMIPSLPINMADAVRKWVSERKAPFVVTDIYREFGISTEKGKANLRVIPKRFVTSGALERSGNPPKCIYISKERVI